VDISFKDSLKTRKFFLYVQGILYHVHTLISLYPNTKMLKQQRWGVPQKVGQNAARILTQMICHHHNSLIFVKMAIFHLLALI
jgi:hypothetical protein